jgi:hypothetical protein
MRAPVVSATAVLALVLASVVPLQAATPSGGTLSRSNPAVTWSGGPILASNPVDFCLPADPACDSFFLTIERLPAGSLVAIVITGDSADDDLDLFVFGPDGKQLARSATGSGREEVTLYSPAAGTYEVQVLSFLSIPGATYAGVAELLRDDAANLLRGAFSATAVDPARYAAGRPSNTAISGQSGPALRIRTTFLGRESFEPTIGINKDGSAFMTTAQFDVAGNLASTEVHRSRDRNRSWQSIQPTLVANTSEPPTTLDPYVYVDPETGRVFNVELYAGCSWLNFSDDEGDSWTRNVVACGVPVNDHQTVVAARPRGVPTLGYPNVVVYCVNQVADSPCGRSLDGGRTFVPAGVAFLGVDAAAGGSCGGLHGHLASDREGRLFLPKGHCSFPWVSMSEDSGATWQRFRVNDYIPQPHHEASAAVDSAGNVYVTWWDSRDRLPYLAISRDHGRTWSTPRLIAPPGVFETNFPTITAGDAGRIAIHFPGSTSPERTSTRPWNTYLMVSVNALASEPLFAWTTANDPADPVRRGDCGPGRCGGMFDFLDIQTSPADGAFWAAAVDTCTNSCISGEGPSDAADGFAVLQLSGPSLWAPDHGATK